MIDLYEEIAQLDSAENEIGVSPSHTLLSAVQDKFAI